MSKGSSGGRKSHLRLLNKLSASWKTGTEKSANHGQEHRDRSLLFGLGKGQSEETALLSFHSELGTSFTLLDSIFMTTL